MKELLKKRKAKRAKKIKKKVLRASKVEKAARKVTLAAIRRPKNRLKILTLLLLWLMNESQTRKTKRAKVVTLIARTAPVAAKSLARKVILIVIKLKSRL